jgi:hypothetical protein
MDICVASEGHVACSLSPLSGGFSPHRLVEYEGNRNPLLRPSFEDETWQTGITRYDSSRQLRMTES